MPLDFADPSQVSTSAWLALVLPAQGLRCVAVPLGAPKTGLRHFYATDNAQAAATVAKLDGLGENVFYALGGFTPDALDRERDDKNKLVRGGRKQANVGWLRSFWADLDCGEGKPYATARDALLSLKNFLDLSGLPKPFVVSSGRGIHLYWPMDADVERTAWKAVAVQLKQAFSIGGLHADPSRTSDEASVLRPVGSHHRKGEPRPVRLLKNGEIWPLEDLAAQVGAFLAAHNVLPDTVRVTAPALNSDLAGGIEYPPTDADKIADRCAVAGLVRDTQGNVDQPTWYGVLGLVAHCENGDEIAQEWSCGHPHYDPDEVQTKLEQQRRFRPTTCKKLGEAQPDLCKACVFFGELASPIRLGMSVPEVTPEAISTQAVRIGAGSVTAWPPVMSEAEALVRMEPIAFVHDYGGSACYVVTGTDGAIRRITPQEITEGYNCYRVRAPSANGEPKLVPLGTYYMRSPRRRVVDRIIYDPEGTLAQPGEIVINTWGGFGRTARRGCWSKIRRHLFEVICRGNQQHFRYLIQWLAFAVQRPGTAPGSVVVLQSEREGTGKTTVGELMARVFGRHALMLNTPEQITGEYNGHLEGMSFLVVNEVTFAGDHGANRRFKSIVTEARLLIHHKYQRPYAVPNMLHIMITTNEPWAVQAGVGARRFFVLDVDDRRAGDKRYFDALHREADKGGIEAMLDFLLRLNLSQFDPRQVPRTSALADQQERSASIEVQWALSVAEEPQGELFVRFGQPAATSDLHRSFEVFAKGRFSRIPALNVFGRWFAKLGLPTAQVGEARHKGYFLPSADEFRDAVRRLAGIQVR